MYQAITMFSFVILVLSPMVVGQTSQPANEAVTPKAAMLATIVAARGGDAAAIEASLYAENSDDQYALSAFAALTVAQSHYEKAMTDRFGKTAIGKFGMRSDELILQLSTAREKIEGDNAVVTLGDEPHTISFKCVRSGGRWHVPVSFITKRIENVPVHEVGGRYIDMGKAFDETAAAINAGQYPRAEDAANSASTQVDEAARGVHAQ